MVIASENVTDFVEIRSFSILTPDNVIGKKIFISFSDHSLIIAYTYESSISVKIRCIWTRLHGIFSHFLSVLSSFTQLSPLFFIRQLP